MVWVGHVTYRVLVGESEGKSIKKTSMQAYICTYEISF
jgi:hypothetical protein